MRFSRWLYEGKPLLHQYIRVALKFWHTGLHLARLKHIPNLTPLKKIDYDALMRSVLTWHEHIEHTQNTQTNVAYPNYKSDSLGQ